MVSAKARLRVMFVDDEAHVLTALRRSLERLDVDWRMHFETDPRRALAFPDLVHMDVVVSDLRMPGLDGLSFLEKARAAGCSARFIVLTGTGDMASAMDAINRIGVFRFYAKPCPAEQLCQGIEDAYASLARHERTEGLLNAALDALPFAVIAVSPDARMMFCNQPATAMLHRHDPLLVDARGILRTRHAADTAHFHGVLNAALTELEAHSLALCDADGRRLTVLVEALGHDQPPQAAIVFVRDIDSVPVPDEDSLRSLFGFTPAEARLAHALGRGLDLADAAAEQGITVSSARTYLRVVFAKTQVGRQSDLIRVLLACGAGRRSS